MSAWIVSKEHIDTMVELAAQGPANTDHRHNGWHGLTWDRDTGTNSRQHMDLEDADRIGQMLITENALSVHYRYQDNTMETLESWMENYSYPWERMVTRWHPEHRRPTAVEGLKIIDCYEYQSCEHPGWETSEAARFCHALTEALIGHLPGYDAAPWGWDRGDAYEKKEETVR